MMESALFPIADAFQMHLTLKGGKVDGQDRRTLPVGPWKLSTWNTVFDDVLDDHRAAVLVKIRKSLYAYVVCYVTTPGSSPKLWMVLFDGKEAGISMNSASQYGEGDVHKTLAKIGRAAKQTLVFKNDQWVKCELSDLDPGVGVESAGGLVAGTAEQQD
jgi:hypothetical protein